MTRLPIRTAAVLCALVAAAAPAAEPPAVPADFAAFQRDVAPLVRAARPSDTDRHWRQIEPAVHQLALAHADRLAALDATARTAAITALAGFIDDVRTAAAATPVLAPDRNVIGLLDPARGLEPKEITAIAAAYGCGPVRVFKQDGPGTTIDGVADDFLAALRAVAGSGAPTTVVVLGHGLPTEIQSYSIRFERLAAALLDGAAGRAADGPVDLGGMVLVCDDCFSTDFLVNLCTALEAGCAARGKRLGSLPACIAGTNRGRVGHADVGENFVPHFWRDVIELYFIRRPHPPAVTLRDFFENVDNMMYGYGRAPLVEGTSVKGWRLVDPEMVQDPVVLVPLDDDDLARLRRILGLPADAPLPRWLDVG